MQPEKRLKVLGILGSPRMKGNTDLMLDSALKAFRNRNFRVQKVVLSKLKFKPCIECGGCDLTGVCVLKDDLSGIYSKIKESDIIIVATPIFFGSISAYTKMFIDRMQCVWVEKYILKKCAKSGNKKLGAFIAVGGARTKKYFHNARSIIKIFFSVIDCHYEKDLFFGGCDELGCILKNKSALKEAYNLGKGLLKKLIL